MKKIVIVSQFNEDCRAILTEAAGDAALIFSSPEAATPELVADAGMIVGPIAPSLLPEAKNLEVLQLQSAGADAYIKRWISAMQPARMDSPWRSICLPVFWPE